MDGAFGFDFLAPPESVFVYRREGQARGCIFSHAAFSAPREASKVS